MAKVAKKARGKFVDEKYLGPEPDLSGKIPTVTEMVKAYAWYNYFYNNDDAKGFVLEYLKSNHKNEKDLIRGISSDVPADRLRTLGWSARILSMGGNLQAGYDFITHTKKTVESSRTSERTGRFVLSSSESGSISEDDRMGEAADGKESNDESTSSEGEKVISIQERIKNKAQDLIADIEDEIDTLIKTGDSKFKINDWLRQKDVKPQVANHIAEFYKPLYAELFDAFNAKEGDLKEAYRRWKKPQLRFYVDFVKEIIGACEMRQEIAKATRKPRKKKVKTPAQQTSKLKYKEKDDTYNLVSIKPTDIVGCNQVWLFNTKTRNVTVYNAMGPAGISVKGSSLFGYDEKTSVTKKLRKPTEQLAKLMSGGKIVLRKFMDDIKSKPNKANGRINIDTILLKVIK